MTKQERTLHKCLRTNARLLMEMKKNFKRQGLVIFKTTMNLHVLSDTLRDMKAATLTCQTAAKK